MLKVYRPSAKCLRNNYLTADHRIILLGGGSAALYLGDKLLQSDMIYRRKDSHLVEIKEEVPTKLFASAEELSHIKSHEIKLPFLVDGVEDQAVFSSYRVNDGSKTINFFKQDRFSNAQHIPSIDSFGVIHFQFSSQLEKEAYESA